MFLKQIFLLERAVDRHHHTKKNARESENYNKAYSKFKLYKSILDYTNKFHFTITLQALQLSTNTELSRM